MIMINKYGEECGVKCDYCGAVITSGHHECGIRATVAVVLASASDDDDVDDIDVVDMPF